MRHDDSSVTIEPEALPHWARVAFAARCARRVQHLLRRHWPDVKQVRIDAVERAIDLTERSAAHARAMDGLEDATTNAVVAAGAALCQMYGMPSPTEPSPSDETDAVIASQIAKVAENAAEAAKGTEQDSAQFALAAFAFAQTVAVEAGGAFIAKDMRRDFAILRRVAHLKGWTDQTPVPPSFFALLSNNAASPRPWWRIW